MGTRVQRVSTTSPARRAIFLLFPAGFLAAGGVRNGSGPTHRALCTTAPPDRFDLLMPAQRPKNRINEFARISSFVLPPQGEEFSVPMNKRREFFARKI